MSKKRQTHKREKKSRKKDFPISKETKARVEAAKAYIENRYQKLLQVEKQQKENWEKLITAMNHMNLPQEQQEKIKMKIMKKEAELLREKRQKLSIKDFKSIDIIGRGAFGEVRLCRWEKTGQLVAVKKMKKTEMVFKNQIAHVKAERDVLAAADNPWIVQLICSFQDDKYLYLVMEYLPGGDLMTLLMEKDILSEKEAQFYMAESILAVQSVHKLNYIHRDLKPDNVLIDVNGHIKLSDFGLCKNADIKSKKFTFGKHKVKKSDEEKLPELKLPVSKKSTYRRSRKKVYSTVGTPDYIAPEVFGEKGYTETVDWWSLGVILFEMLVGYPPFFAEEPSITCQKILHWRKTLIIPHEANLSSASIDLIRRLVADPQDRLGIMGVEEIKAHPFFAGCDWKKIRIAKAQNIPQLKSDIDTKYFEDFKEEEPWVDHTSDGKRNRKDVNFIGYTFKRDIENERSGLISALESLEKIKQSKTRNQQQQQDEKEQAKQQAFEFFEEKQANKKQKLKDIQFLKMKNGPGHYFHNLEKKKEKQSYQEKVRETKKNFQDPIYRQFNKQQKMAQSNKVERKQFNYQNKPMNQVKQFQAFQRQGINYQQQQQQSGQQNYQQQFAIKKRDGQYKDYKSQNQQKDLKGFNGYKNQVSGNFYKKYQNPRK